MVRPLLVKLAMKLAALLRVSRVDFERLDNINTQENNNSLKYGSIAGINIPQNKVVSIALTYIT